MPPRKWQMAKLAKSQQLRVSTRPLPKVQAMWRDRVMDEAEGRASGLARGRSE
jgi:hypothetical protein